jgi:hypothetical protein
MVSISSTRIQHATTLVLSPSTKGRHLKAPSSRVAKLCGMAIEAVSYPANLDEWDEDKHPFYLELVGETRPLLDTAYAEVIPAGPGGAAETVHPAPVYEYWWTIGHGGVVGRKRRFSRLFGRDDKEIWKNLEDDAAHVLMFFPLGGGWRIKELTATLKYLTPVAEQRSIWTQVAKDWQALEPLAQGASQLAGTVAPGAGAAVRGTVGVIDAMAKLRLTSLPQTGKFPWSAAKVTTTSPDGVVQGVLWRLPRSVLTLLGGRITGGLAVTFIPAGRQEGEKPHEGDLEPKARPILIHAGVFANDRKVWVPSQSHFLRLHIEPRVG